VWANYTTIGDVLLIQNFNGKDIVSAVVEALGPYWSFGKMGWVEGLILKTISHGEVTIAIGAGK